MEETSNKISPHSSVVAPIKSHKLCPLPRYRVVVVFSIVKLKLEKKLEKLPRLSYNILTILYTENVSVITNELELKKKEIIL